MSTKAVILAGGLGMRMRPFTFSIPKPLMPFGDKTILEHAILNLKSYGTEQLLIALGYMPELIKAYCRDGQQWGLRIDYLIEEKPLGTAGSLALAHDKISPEENFILMNGDVVTDLNFADLMGFHTTHGFAVTMAYAKIVIKSAFGVVDVEDGCLVNLREKPEMTQLVNAGIYAINGRCIPLVPSDSFFTMPQLMAKVMERGENVGAYLINGFWRGLETREDIDEALSYLQG